MKTRSFGVISLLLLSALLITSCGGGSSSRSSSQPIQPSIPAPGDPAYTDPAGTDLSKVVLSAPVVKSLGQVEVDGLPPSVSSRDLYASYYMLDSSEFSNDSDEEGRRLPLFTSGDKVYLLPPLLDEEGARIVVVITDGDSRSEAFELNLEPLPPPREGSIDDALAAVNRLLEAATTALGRQYPKEWEDWRDKGLNQMPEYLLPLMQAWHGMLDPENDMSLINQKDTLDPEARTLVERLLAAMPLIDALNKEAESLEGEVGRILEDIVDASPAMRSSFSQGRTPPDTFAMRSLAPMTQALPMLQPPASGRVELEGLIEINTPETLATWLDRYENVRKTKRDLEIFDDTVGAYVAAVATAASLAAGPGATAAVSGARIAAVEAVTNLVSSLSTAGGVAMWFLPCCIVELETELDPVGGLIAYEDAEENQVKLTSAKVRAESEGVPLTRKMFDRIVDQTAKILNDSMSHAVTEIYSKKVAENLDDFGASDLVGDFVQANIEASITDELAKLLGAPLVFVWDDIDLNANLDVKKWLNVERDTRGGTGRAILTEASTPDHRLEFHLNEEAFNRTDSLLRFIVNQDELYSQLPAAMDTHQVQLQYITVDFEPPSILLEEGSNDPVEFTVIVENSAFDQFWDPYIDEPLTLEPAIGSIRKSRSRLIRSRGRGEFYFEYLPPADPDDLPPGTIVTVRTHALSRDGVRSGRFGAPPERSGTMHIARKGTITDILVEPNTACVENGKTLQLTALDQASGDPVSEVIWEASIGTVSNSGLFSAPANGSGEVRISAHLASGGGSAGATVRYGECSCWWSASVSGGINQQNASDSTAIVLNEQSRITRIDVRKLSEPLVGFALNLSNPIPLGATGQYTAVVSSPGVNTHASPGNLSSVPAGAWTNPTLWAPDLLSPLRVNITRHEAVSGPAYPPGSRILEGTVSGSVASMTVSINPGGGLAVPDVGQLTASWSGIYWYTGDDAGGDNLLSCEPPH